MCDVAKIIFAAKCQSIVKPAQSAPSKCFLVLSWRVVRGNVEDALGALVMRACGRAFYSTAVVRPIALGVFFSAATRVGA